MTRLVIQIKMYGEVMSYRLIVTIILRYVLPNFNDVVVTIEESKEFSSLTKEELKGKLESHEKIMVERYVTKSKSDMELEKKSARDRKGIGN